MNEIRTLNSSGQLKFAAFIQALSSGQHPAIPHELHDDDAWTDVLGRVDRDIEDIDLSTQWTMSRDLHAVFKDAGITTDRRKEPGLWAWLSLVFFESICPIGKAGMWKPGPLNLWIPSEIWTRFYRNFMAGPYRVYEMHQLNPELAKPILSGAPNKQTEVYAQIAASQEVVQSKGVLETVRLLYWDEAAQALKRGHAGKAGGSIRRFPVFMNQISLTWDLNDISGTELLELLPIEYARFKSAS